MSKRIEQCKANIAALQEELKQLEEARLKPKHGDIVVIGEHLENRRIVIITTNGDAMTYNITGGLMHVGPCVAWAYKTGDYKVIGNVFDQAGGE